MVDIVMLRPDGQNWSKWREYTQKCAELQGLANYLAGTPPARFSEIRDSIARRIFSCTVPKPISKSFQHYSTAQECIDYLTRQFNKPPRRQLGKTPHGRVNKGAGAAKAPGKTITEDLWINGVSVATPASGLTPVESTIPTTSQKVHEEAADITNPYTTRAEPTRPVGTSRNPPDESPQHLEVAGNEVESWEGVVEECRAHDRIDNKTSRVKMSLDEATTTRPDAPQSTSLEGERMPQVGDGSAELIVRKPDDAEATRDRDHQLTTSTSRNHPADTVTTTVLETSP